MLKLRLSRACGRRSPALQAMGVSAAPAVVVFRRGRVAAIAAGYSEFGSSACVEVGSLAPRETSSRCLCTQTVLTSKSLSGFVSLGGMYASKECVLRSCPAGAAAGEVAAQGRGSGGGRGLEQRG